MKKILTITLSIIFAVCLFVTPAFAAYGLEETAGAAGLTQYGGDLPTLAGNIIGTALSMVGVLFFILMLYGGFLWMTARGKEDQANKAKETIIAAVIGIIVVLSAYAITNFVFSSVEGGGEFSGTGGETAVVGCSGLAIQECVALECYWSEDAGRCLDPNAVECSNLAIEECLSPECYWEANAGRCMKP